VVLPHSCSQVSRASGRPASGRPGSNQAREHAYRVLQCRGVEAEVSLSFTSLSDLLVDVLEDPLLSLAAPRRRALAVALLLEEPGDSPPDPRGVALAFLDALHALNESGPVVVAVDDLERALDEHKQMEGGFELGRTLLALGSVRGRARQKRAARETLEQALAIFEELGARLWSERTREELGRISGRRRSAPGELTKTEDRVAALAAQGLSNKAIASTLYVSPHTVEAHLSSIYRKLGVRSRSALAGRLATPRDPAAKI
jgi:DNA-binding NarL/FixJ family response regulator